MTKGMGLMILRGLEKNKEQSIGKKLPHDGERENPLIKQ